MNNISSDFSPKNCCGCGACVNACPTKAVSFGTDKFGFLRPFVDENICISCGKCIRSCPYRISEKQKISSTIEPIVYAAVNKNSDVVKTSSSGGIFYSIAKNVLDKGGIVFGASMLENFKVCHIAVEKVEDLFKIQRSKYIQSFIGHSYTYVKKELVSGRLVLFSGTPCQIAGLNSFLLNHDYGNLLTVEVVCHGTPSQDFFDGYRTFLESKDGPLKNYIFRYKSKPNNGMKWFSAYETNKRKFVFNWPEDSYNYFYMKSLIYRDSCYECKFAKKERVADLTLCDYWHWNGLHSKDFNSRETVSGILANTEKALHVIKDIASELHLVKSDFSYLSSHNSCLLEPCGEKKDRLYILNKWKNEGYAALDADFRCRYKKQILKYQILRHIPDRIFSLLARLKNEY